MTLRHSSCWSFGPDIWLNRNGCHCSSLGPIFCNLKLATWKALIRKGRKQGLMGQGSSGLAHLEEQLRSWNGIHQKVSCHSRIIHGVPVAISKYVSSVPHKTSTMKPVGHVISTAYSEAPKTVKSPERVRQLISWRRRWNLKVEAFVTRPSGVSLPHQLPDAKRKNQNKMAS